MDVPYPSLFVNVDGCQAKIHQIWEINVLYRAMCVFVRALFVDAMTGSML